jgi:hypothetical protein
MISAAMPPNGPFIAFIDPSLPYKTQALQDGAPMASAP